MATQESTLQIRGMTCSACAARVQKVVNKLDGVEREYVNFPLEQLTDQDSPKEPGIDDLKKEDKKLYGVEKENVNFQLEQMTVQYNPKETGIDDFKKEVEKNGYGVVEAEAEFDVSGMTCANCSQTVEKGLNNMEGVFNANV